MEARNSMLILRGGALGDSVLTFPVFACLRRNWPEARIGCIGYTHLTTLAGAAGLIDEAFSLDGPDAARLFAEDAPIDPVWRKRLAAYDTALSYLHDPDGLVERNLLRSGIARVLTHSPLVVSGHAADHFLKPLAAMGLPVPQDAIPEITLPRNIEEPALAGPAAVSGRVVLLHPGSGSRKKNWPVDKFVTLARRLQELQLAASFLVGEVEAGMTDQLKSVASGTTILYEPDLITLVKILARARAYIGNDSGVTHLAAAVGAPVIALFGPSAAETWGPRGSNVRVIRSAEPTTESLAALNVETVLRALLSITT